MELSAEELRVLRTACVMVYENKIDAASAEVKTAEQKWHELCTVGQQPCERPNSLVRAQRLLQRLDEEMTVLHVALARAERATKVIVAAPAAAQTEAAEPSLGCLSPDALAITEECDALKEMLLRKNRLYGGSALSPMRIASKASPVEQILVRIDDKLSRIKSEQSDEDEDVWGDILGYIVLLRIARKRVAPQ